MSNQHAIYNKLPPLPVPKPNRIRDTLIFVGVFLLSLACGLGLGVLWNWYSELPSIQQLENIEPNLVTRIYSADEVLLKEFFIEKRFTVRLEELPSYLMDAVLAAEDREFYNHWGLNVRRTFVALLKDVMSLRKAQGASTITQQLARNLYLTLKKSWVRKIKEAMTAIKIERRYTKREIFEFYLNQIYLGGGVYGVQAASRRFFKKDATDLTLPEAAMIAAMIRTPELYRPDRSKNWVRTCARRNWVLKSMHRMKTISRKDYVLAARESVAGDTLGERKPSLAPYYTEMVRQYLERKYGTHRLYTEGLTVFTTLRYQPQKTVEDSLQKHLRKLQNTMNTQFVSRHRLHRKLHIGYDSLIFMLDTAYHRIGPVLRADKMIPDTVRGLRIVQAAIIALDTKTGAILAMIGGRNFDESEFNRATQALRQPGSAFKPLVYTTAIRNGFSPASVVLDQPISVETPVGVWRPENYNKTFSGPVTLRRALAKSINIASIQLITKITPKEVVKTARRMGITHPLHPVPALAVGSCEVTPLEITSVYSVFANSGVRAEPYFIDRIVDKNGNVLEGHAVQEKEVLDPQTAYVMADMLKTVVMHGTGIESRWPGGFLRPAGGKTGTTNDYTDAWFVGFTPHITCGVWVGIDSKRTLGPGKTGSQTALPIWTIYMLAAHKGLPDTDFERPPGIKTKRVCTESWLLARPTCPKTVDDIFIEGTEPKDFCHLSHFEKRKEHKPLLF